MFEISTGQIIVSSEFSINLDSKVQVQKGKRNYYHAPNGSGKTIFFRFLADQLTSQKENYSNVPTIAYNNVLTEPPITTICSFVPQSSKDGLFGLSVNEEINSSVNTLDKKTVYSLIQALGLEDFLCRNSSQLSDGERTRVLIASALAERTDFIILDEWETHLDEHWTKIIKNLLDEYCDYKGLTTIELLSDKKQHSDSKLLNIGSFQRPILKQINDEELSYIFGKTPFDNDVKVTFNGLFKNGVFKKSVSPCVFSQSKITAVIGENGSGKTTLIRSLAKSKSSFFKTGTFFRTGSVAIVMTDPSLQIKVLSLEEILFNAGLDKKAVGIVLTKILFIDKSVSSGNLNYARRKLLGVTLALISQSKVIAIDEFDAGLDFNSRATMIKLIEYASKQVGKSIVITATSDKKVQDFEIDQTIEIKK